MQNTIADLPTSGRVAMTNHSDEMRVTWTATATYGCCHKLSFMSLCCWAVFPDVVVLSHLVTPCHYHPTLTGTCLQQQSSGALWPLLHGLDPDRQGHRLHLHPVGGLEGIQWWYCTIVVLPAMVVSRKGHSSHPPRADPMSCSLPRSCSTLSSHVGHVRLARHRRRLADPWDVLHRHLDRPAGGAEGLLQVWQR